MFNKTNHFFEDKVFYYIYLEKYNWFFNAVNSIFSLSRSHATSFYIFKKYNFFDIINYKSSYNFFDRVLCFYTKDLFKIINSKNEFSYEYLDLVVKKQMIFFLTFHLNNNNMKLDKIILTSLGVKLFPTRLISRFIEPLIFFDRLRNSFLLFLSSNI
jgi:hypothetical protein